MTVHGHIQENSNFNAMIQYATRHNGDIVWSRRHTSK